MLSGRNIQEADFIHMLSARINNIFRCGAMQFHTAQLFLQLITLGTPLIQLASYVQIIIRQGLLFEWDADMWCLIILNLLVLLKTREK
jgi:hypothetical protein